MIEACTFTANNAIWGAGLFVEFQDRAHDNDVMVFNSTLDSNICDIKYKSGGGGTRIAYIFYDEAEVKYNHVSFHSCHFHENRAYWGGGLSLLSAREPTLVPTNTLELTNCEWTGNVAAIGAAVDLLVWHLTKNGTTLHSKFTNCRFKNNTVSYTNRQGDPVGIGIMYADTVPVIFEESVIFEENNGTALAAVATTLHISDHTVANFTRNRGRFGGAISLRGLCYIHVHPNSALNFVSNKAEYLGGAIYSHSIAEHDFREGTQNCFISYSLVISPMNWTARFYFKDNTAGNLPNSIYTTSVLTCEWWYDGRYLDVEHRYAREVFCWDDTKWVYENSNCSHQIMTAPAAFTSPDSNQTYHHAYSMSAIPGKLTQVPVQTADDRGINSSGRTVLTARSESGNLSIDTSSVYVSDNHIQLLGVGGTTGTVVLETQDPRVIYTEVNVTLQTCPPGFVHSGEGDMSTCECGDNYGGYLQCSGTLFQSKLQRGAWIGYYTYNRETQLVVGRCPYCSNFINTGEEYLYLPDDPAELDSYLCGRVDRTGVLCGDCKDNFGPAVNSRVYKCVSCSEEDTERNWLFYLLTEFLPITVFFFIVVIFRISVTTGPANAFVFFAQVLTTVFEIDSDDTIPLTDITEAAPELQAVYIVPYDIWNLNFFQPVFPDFCLSSNINTVQLMSLGYITAFYPLLLVFTFLVVLWLYDHDFKPVTFLCRPVHKCLHNLRRQWNLQNSLLDAFGTFLLLSYTKFTLVSVLILNQTPLFNHRGHTVGPGVMYFNGNITFYSREFIPYFIVAVFVLATFVAVPPLILIAPSVTKALEKAGIKKLSKWQPGQKLQYFLNIFHGCYKDGSEPGTHDFRWFAGLYFFIRLLLYILYSVTPNWFTQYVWQQLICILAILLFTIFQPYRINWYNKLDTFIFGLLAAINSFTMYNYHLLTIGQNLSPASFSLQYILIFFPLVYMILYASYQFWITYQAYLKALHQKLRKCFRKGNTEDAPIGVVIRNPTLDNEFLDYTLVVEGDGRILEPNSYRSNDPEAAALYKKLDIAQPAARESHHDSDHEPRGPEDENGTF